MIVEYTHEDRMGRSEVAKGASQQSFLLYDGIFTDRESRIDRNFEIQLALTKNQRHASEELINRMYKWRGYGSDHRLSDASNCFTFNAVVDGEVVGTLSLTVDVSTGLAADNTFQDLLDKTRIKSGRKICELTKFAFSSTIAPMNVIASLFHTIFIFGTQKFACTDLFIEVNPRHIRFYQTLLGFSLIDRLRPNASVGAPSQLMRLSVKDIETYISTNTNGGYEGTRSLYPYFLSAAQELIIHERMAALENQWPFNSKP